MFIVRIPANIKIQNTEVDINGLCKVLKTKNVSIQPDGLVISTFLKGMFGIIRLSFYFFGDLPQSKTCSKHLLVKQRQSREPQNAGLLQICDCAVMLILSNFAASLQLHFYRSIF